MPPVEEEDEEGRLDGGLGRRLPGIDVQFSALARRIIHEIDRASEYEL